MVYLSAASGGLLADSESSATNHPLARPMARQGLHYAMGYDAHSGLHHGGFGSALRIGLELLDGTARASVLDHRLCMPALVFKAHQGRSKGKGESGSQSKHYPQAIE